MHVERLTWRFDSSTVGTAINGSRSFSPRRAVTVGGLPWPRAIRVIAREPPGTADQLLWVAYRSYESVRVLMHACRCLSRSCPQWECRSCGGRGLVPAPAFGPTFCCAHQRLQALCEQQVSPAFGAAGNPLRPFLAGAKPI